MRSKASRAACFLVFSLFAVSPLRAAGFTLGTPGPDDAPQLVTSGAEPMVRIPVAHQHTASGCGGYLYFSASTIRFEVLYPEKDKGHAFQYARADLVTAQQWHFMGTTMPEAEFKFRDGRVFHFFRVRRKLAEDSSVKMTWDNVLPFEILLQAATNFPSVLAQVQAASAPAVAAAGPAAGMAQPAAAKPLDDTVAMDSAGLDVPPPPPWARPAKDSAATTGNRGGP
jgi:hypothetical protein